MSEADRLPPVLIVEDDPEARRALEWMLEIGGYTPIGVATAGEALDYLRDGQAPRAVILDLRLPDMSGDALYARIRAEPSLRGLPVIVHTGRNEIPPMPGVFATILKGAPPRTLIGAVDEAIGRSKH
jgi:CheY-like chemotaxis protein